MIIFTPIIETNDREILPIPKYDGWKMSLEEFKNFSIDEPGFKYEWNNGVLESEILLKESERYIFDNIFRKFVLTKGFERGDSLLPEADVYLKELNKYRRPDASYFFKDQIRSLDHLNSIPLFIIEVISPSNSSVDVENKMKEYFLSGAKVVWHIYPTFKEVRVYASPKEVKICTDSDLCSIGEINPELSISVSDLFKI